jgi:hypothetical protein
MRKGENLNPIFGTSRRLAREGSGELIFWIDQVTKSFYKNCNRF